MNDPLEKRVLIADDSPLVRAQIMRALGLWALPLSAFAPKTKNRKEHIQHQGERERQRRLRRMKS